MPTDKSAGRDWAALVLAGAQAGNTDAERELLALLYAELHGMAAGFLRAERPDHTLQPTALVNEAYLRLVGRSPMAFENRAHFFGAAARCMRQILIKHAEARRAVKRGGGRQRVTLAGTGTPPASSDVDLLMLDDALTRLEQLDARQCKVVELRFFAGMSVEEAAAVLGVSARTVELDWQMARAWLALELSA